MRYSHLRHPGFLKRTFSTTATSLIAALASTGSGFINSIQVSLAHLFFNLFGILLFFAVPITRKLPVGLAKFVGKRTQRYRWFAVAYIITMFLLLPLVALGLALASEIALYGELIPACSLKTHFYFSCVYHFARCFNFCWYH